MRSPKFIQFNDLILYEDDHILLINKPVDVASLDDKSKRNINHLAKKYHPDLTLCHRLDKMTSGILLLAKGVENHRALALQFQHRQVQKEYHTLVEGTHHFDAYQIDLPLAISANKRVSIDKQQGKPAQTVVHSETFFKHFTFLRCEPITGRMHQIRVHLSAMKCPIVGDQLYGGRDFYLSRIKQNYRHSSKKEEQPINHGYLLHAHRLAFTHPASEEPMEFTAPYPKYFEVTLKVLRKYDAK